MIPPKLHPEPYGVPTSIVLCPDCGALKGKACAGDCAYPHHAHRGRIRRAQQRLHERVSVVALLAQGQHVCALCDDPLDSTCVGMGSGEGDGRTGAFGHPECYAILRTLSEPLTPDSVRGLAQNLQRRAQYAHEIIAALQAKVDALTPKILRELPDAPEPEPVI